MKTPYSMLVVVMCMLGACTHSDDDDAPRGDTSEDQDQEELPVAETGHPKPVEGVNPPKPVDDDVKIPAVVVPDDVPATEDAYNRLPKSCKKFEDGGGHPKPKTPATAPPAEQ